MEKSWNFVFSFEWEPCAQPHPGTKEIVQMAWQWPWTVIMHRACVGMFSYVFLVTLGTHHLISGGGGPRVFVACKFFFLPPRKKQSFFFAINVRQFFFYVSSKNFFVVCFPYHVGYHLVFFSGRHIFHKFRQQTFSAHIFTRLFFSDFCGGKLVFSIFF